MRNIGLIGFGAIGAAIVERWEQALAPDLRLAAVLVRASRVDAVRRCLPAEVAVVTDLAALIAQAPRAVVEAAGHEAVGACGEAVLEAGADLLVLSVGALACEDLRARLQAAARRGGARIVILAGALAGFDGLASLGVTGLTSVKYTSVKPVDAWRGTAADEGGGLDGLASPRVIFSGSAREAAHAFPKNANLAASVALRGLGFDRTQVELVADPAARTNRGRIQAESEAGSLDVTLSGPAFSGNPRSSRVTALSALAALRGIGAPIVFA